MTDYSPIMAFIEGSADWMSLDEVAGLCRQRALEAGMPSHDADGFMNLLLYVTKAAYEAGYRAGRATKQ